MGDTICRSGQVSVWVDCTIKWPRSACCSSQPPQTGQQLDRMLSQCWTSVGPPPTVKDDGPAVNHHYFNVSCQHQICRHRVGSASVKWHKHWTNAAKALGQRLLFAGMGVRCIAGGPASLRLAQHGHSVSQYPANKRHWTNVDLMLAHRLRLWANIKSTLGQRLVLARYMMVMCTD